ncbi:MAG: helix-turn-helix transcriptional regulator [Clostridia bacterium]|nr:helix-turn-helix transcriptional regulator [Clostridia bacterium]
MEIWSDETWFNSLKLSWFMGEEHIERSPGVFLWPDTCPCNSVVFIQSGYVEVGKQEPLVKVQAPALIMIGAHVHCHWINPVHYTGTWFQFNAFYMGTEISSLFLSPVIITGEKTVKIGEKIRRMLQAEPPAEGDFHAELYFKLEQQRLLTDIVSQIFSHAEPISSPITFLEEEFSSFLTYLEQHIEEKWTVEKMAQLCCRSQASFYRDFKKKMGKSPLQYVIHRRMEIAGLWLLRGKNVADAASAVGYKDVSYFDRLFFKHYSCTPLAYKRGPGHPFFAPRNG